MDRVCLVWVGWVSKILICLNVFRPVVGYGSNFKGLAFQVIKILFGYFLLILRHVN